MTIGMYVAPGIGILFLLTILMAISNTGTFSLNGEEVTGGEFLRAAGPLFASTGALCLAIGYGIKRERPWVRWLMVAYWLVHLAGSIGFGWADSGIAGASVAAAQGLFALLLAWWYLFEKENVVEYFRALQMEETAREQAHRSVQL